MARRKEIGSMKKLTLLIMFLCFIVMIQTIRVGQELRMVQIYADEKGLHHVYFTEPGSGKSPILLGEEIFKNGQKIFDNYREND